MKAEIKNVTNENIEGEKNPLQEIKMLIDLANIVPPTAKLPEITTSDLSRVYDEWNIAVDFTDYAFPVCNEIWNEVYKEIKKYSQLINFLENSIKEEIHRINARTAKPIYANEVFKIINREPEPFDITSMMLIETYSGFFRTRNKFRFVAYALHLKRGFYLDNYDYLNSRPVFYPIIVSRENGVFLVPDTKIECLFGVDLERLRICQICEKIFWAERIDSWGCSSPHNLNLRQKRFRKTSKEKEIFKKVKLEKWLNKEKRQEKLNQNFSEKRTK